MDYVQMASRILKICNYSGGFLFFNGLCRIRCWESSYERLYLKQERLAYHLQFLQELTTTENQPTHLLASLATLNHGLDLYSRLG